MLLFRRLCPAKLAVQPVICTAKTSPANKRNENVGPQRVRKRNNCCTASRCDQHKQPSPKMSEENWVCRRRPTTPRTLFRSSSGSRSSSSSSSSRSSSRSSNKCSSNSEPFERSWHRYNVDAGSCEDQRVQQAVVHTGRVQKVKASGGHGKKWRRRRPWRRKKSGNQKHGTGGMSTIRGSRLR